MMEMMNSIILILCCLAQTVFSGESEAEVIYIPAQPAV